MAAVVMSTDFWNVSGFHWPRLYSNVCFSFHKSVKLSSILPLLCLSLQTLSKIAGAETVR